MTTATATNTSTPENMAEVLRLAYSAERAKSSIRGKESEQGGKEAVDNAPITYVVRPGDEAELTATLWEPNGKNWTRSHEKKKAVTKEEPFIAAVWRTGNSDGLQFEFWSNDMPRDGEGNALKPVWQLTVSAAELDGLDVTEKMGGSVISEWLGKEALNGAGAPEV